MVESVHKHMIISGLGRNLSNPTRCPSFDRPTVSSFFVTFAVGFVRVEEV